MMTDQELEERIKRGTRYFGRPPVLVMGNSIYWGEAPDRWYEERGDHWTFITARTWRRIPSPERA